MSEPYRVEGLPVRLVAAPGERIEIEDCPGGPALVRGTAEVLDADGIAHPVARSVAAVCRCGHSGRLPWCDTTHKVTGGA